MKEKRPESEAYTEHLDQYEAVLNEYLDTIEQFLIQLGTPQHDIPHVAYAIFDKYKHEVLTTSKIPTLPQLLQSSFVVHKKEQSPLKVRSLFKYPEDQELFEALQSLPLREKAAISIICFHHLSKEDASFIISEHVDDIEQLLHQGITNMKQQLLDGEEFELTDEQMDKSLSFLSKSFKELKGTIHPSDILNHDIEDKQEAVQEPEPVSKWPWLAGGLAIVLSIGLLFSLPDTNDEVTGDKKSAEQSEKEEEVPKIPEEKLEEVEDKFNIKIKELAGKLGVSTDDLREVEPYQQTFYTLDYMKEINNNDINLEERRDLINHFDQYTDFLLGELNTPIESVQIQIEEMNITDQADIHQSDMITQQLMFQSRGLSEKYNEKLNRLHKDHLNQNRSYFNEEELPSDIRDMRENITQNGFQYSFNHESTMFEVSLGGAQFEKISSLLHPIHQEYLVTMSSALYTNDYDKKMDFQESSIVLIEAEKMLIKLQENNMTNMGVYSQLAFEHEQLLNQFIFGTDLSPVFKSDVLKDEVRTAWESVIETQETKELETVQVVNQFYEELAENSFEKIFPWDPHSNQLQTQYTQSMNHTEEVPSVRIPLDGELSDRFTEYQQNNNEEILAGLTPEEVVQFYLHAIFLRDVNVMHSLLAETSDRPSKDQFVDQTPRDNPYKNDLSTIVDVAVESNNGNQMVVQIVMQGGRTENIVLIEANGVVKVKYEENEYLF